jgi:hypothetical protein
MHIQANSRFARKRSRFGCLGCLGKLIVLLVLGAIVYLALIAVFEPWAFFLGGSFHINPQWQGWGRMHSKTSGDYVLFVRFEPRFGGNRSMVYAGSSLTGVGYLCTPRGERFRMKLSGGMRAHLHNSTDGEAVNLSMYNQPVLHFLSDNRPSINVRGRWHNPNLVMDDHGSIWNAFQPDGRVYLGHESNRPYSSEIIPITLAPGSYSDFEAACVVPRQ